MTAYADNKKKICKSLTGYPEIECENIIITPLCNIFEQLRAAFNMPEVNNNGFYLNFSCTTSSGAGVLVICVPQGMQAQDVMYAFSNKKILLLGYAGSLTTRFNIGDIVEACKAVTFSGSSYTLSAVTKLEKAAVGYSPVLIGELAEKYHASAKEYNCDVVDMETSYCACAAEKNQNAFSSLLMISDIIGKTDFWELTSDDLEGFAEGNKRLIRLVSDYYFESEAGEQ